MSLSAVAPKTTEHVSPLLRRAEQPEFHEEETTTTPKAPEVMLFAKRAEYAAEAPRVTATHKPTFEYSGAAVSSVHTPPSLFTTNSEGRLVASTGFAHAGSVATALPSALSSPEGNSKGRDKHDDGSPQYVSAHKTRADIRQERLNEPILGGIFSRC